MFKKNEERDERIMQGRNRIGALAYFIVYWLLIIDILVRQFYLKQHISEYVDIFIIFLASALFVNLGVMAKGFITDRRRKILTLNIPVAVVVILSAGIIMGNINSIQEAASSLIAAVVGASVVYGLYYLLYSRWKKRNDLE